MADDKFTIVIPEELHLKVIAKSKTDSISKAEIARQALELYFKKQDDENVLNFILSKIESLSGSHLSDQNLDLDHDLLQSIYKMIVKIYIQATRTNVFLNSQTEDYLKPEDYKKLRKKVSDEMGVIIKNEGLNI